jgi:hypothetical protein
MNKLSELRRREPKHVLDLLVLVGIWKLESMSAVEFVGT